MIAPGRGSGLAIGLTYSEWPLLAEAVSKLHNSLTPEVAFKHNVRRY